MNDKVTELRTFLDNLNIDENRRRSWIRWFCYAGVLFSLILSWYVSEVYSQSRIESDFRQLCDRTQQQIAERVDNYAQMNRSMVAFFESSREVTSEEFSHYVRQLNVDEHFPGITACSATFVVNEAEVEAFEAKHNIRTYPVGDHPTKTIVTYIEPIHGNEVAVGLDTWSREPLRRVLIESAAKGEATISDAIRLVQETQDNTLAFLVYLPKYKSNSQKQAVEDVEVYLAIVVRAPDFCDTLFGDKNGFRFELYDGEEVNDEAVMYRDPESTENGYTLTEQRTIDVAHHKWTFVIEKTVQYGDDFHNVGNILVFLLGCLFSTWMFLLR